ncbi:hypothetical protein FRC17_003783 [Serendipita sp. 399]|nr:hypothetical protein FRC17_003783 [Serendipita sp. 399]
MTWLSPLLRILLLSFVLTKIAEGTGHSQREEAVRDFLREDHVSGHTNNWAVLVCSSRYWFNYRHMANTLGMYRTVKRLGIPDSNIILMLADDVSCNARNRFPASVYSNSRRTLDLYGENIEVDYRGYEVTVENFLRLLTGRVEPSLPRSKRLLTDEKSNIFVYMTGHGGAEFLKFQDNEEISAFDIADAFEQMWQKKRYHEIFFMIDTCQANTMYSKFYSPNILATGSSELGESSYSYENDADIGVAVIDRYTHLVLSYLENINKTSQFTMQHLFDAYDFNRMRSHAGVRTDLFKRDPSKVLLTEFFGGIAQADVVTSGDVDKARQFAEHTAGDAKKAREDTEDLSVTSVLPQDLIVSAKLDVSKRIWLGVACIALALDFTILVGYALQNIECSVLLLVIATIQVSLLPDDENYWRISRDQLDPTLRRFCGLPANTSALIGGLTFRSRRLLGVGYKERRRNKSDLTLSSPGSNAMFSKMITVSSMGLVVVSWLTGMAWATPLLYDGRAATNLSESTFDDLSGAYVYVVKGSKKGSDYIDLTKKIDPTPLWQKIFQPASEKTISVSIDPTSIFVPGGNPANAQNGFRRTEVIAQPRNRTVIESGRTVFHFSVLRDERHDLNYKHEYQVVFIEPNDGSHVFGLQIGSPFTYPTGRLPVPKAQYLRILARDLTVLFETPFTSDKWHNFAVQVDWDALTLGVYYSKGAGLLTPTSRRAVVNKGLVAGPDGQGDFHFGLLKLPIADPADTPSQATDVVHRGIQENTTETLHYSGVFVESVAGGVSIGYGLRIPALKN